MIIAVRDARNAGDDGEPLPIIALHVMLQMSTTVLHRCDGDAEKRPGLQHWLLHPVAGRVAGRRHGH